MDEVYAIIGTLHESFASAAESAMQAVTGFGRAPQASGGTNELEQAQTTNHPPEGVAARTEAHSASPTNHEIRRES